MSSWVALNIEPDEAVEEEVDDTKEIQIEEALKLYQNALKLHSQGPQFYPQAAEAYDALLKSEIFKYPESISDFKRPALQNSENEPFPSELPGYDAATDSAEAIGESDINDSTSSTLLQTIYLSYKNHGQFLLDSLQSLLQNVSEQPEAARDSTANTTEGARAALTSFAEALERDDTDLNLWRQSSRLSGALQSYRLVRYCLESVLADDENRLEVRTEQLGLEETIAEERLRNALQSLNDRLAVSQVPVKRPKKALIKFLQRQADPYPYLPVLPENLEDMNPSRKSLALKAMRHVIKPSSPTWDAVGEEILQLLEDDDDIQIGPGSSIEVQLPAIMSPEPEEIEHKDTQQPDTLPKPQNEEDQSTEQPDVIMSDSQPPAIKTEEPEQAGEPAADGQTPPGDDQTDEPKTDPQDDQQVQQPEDANQREEAAADDLDSRSNGYRKRSSASAANDEHAENQRAKSRRTRARESNVDPSMQTDEVTFDQSKYYEDRLEMYIHADEWLFEATGAFLSNIGVEELGTIEYLRKHMSLVCSTDSPVDSIENIESLLSQDLGSIISNWDDQKVKALSESDNFSNLHDIQSLGKSGLAIFLEHSKKSGRKSGVTNVFSGGEELPTCLKPINDGWTSLDEVAFSWLKGLLMPAFGKFSVQDGACSDEDWCAMESTYTSSQWPESLKETVLQILQLADEYVYNRLSEKVDALDYQILHQSSDSTFKYSLEHFSELEMIQAIFELHLDIYASVNSPNSEFDQGARLKEYDSLTRWSVLARNSLGYFVDYSTMGESQNNILLRHLWASSFHSNMAPDVQREHILLCLQDLKHIFDRLGNPVVSLTNNAAMPELSSEAIDQEVSKLKSMGFFIKIFSPESEDPVDMIETIEPLLEPSSIEYTENGTALSESHDTADPASDFEEMASFLDRGDATLRLFLWRRLQEAYRAIDYPPKIISCYLRSIETIITELWSAPYAEQSCDDRYHTLLRWLKSLDTILSKLVSQALRDSDKAYECLDMEHLKSSMSAVARLLKLLHSFTLYEDSVRVGQVPAPEFRGSLAKSLEGFRERLREMEVRCWILQYTLMKEAIAQNKELFAAPNEDRIGYLRAVHYALGIRKMCRRSHKEFLRLLKSEFHTVETKEDLDLEICQVFYDLHGYRLINSDLITDHGCTSERIDRATAIMMIDFVMRQAMKVNIKDLSKSDLKSTIDKMQQAIGNSKSSTALTFNRRIFSAYLKSPINPTEVFRAARGVEDLPLTSVATESALIAQKGWFFLLGYSALAKFRSQKRLTPVGTTELDEGISYFRQDIENRSGRWETWYRLAQTYDSKLEEDITWSAEKINNNQTELATLQRNAIHCYAMALSMANRTAEPTTETRETLSELYTDFGIRMYLSSREPLSMGAFDISGIARHFSNEESQQMYKKEPFREMRLYSVWNFASHLLKRAIVDKPKNWVNHYMLSKCLWKMYSCDDTVRGNAKRVGLEDVLDSLLDAIDTLPQRKDSRSEPIFEPHYKLVSIVHKLVHRDILTPAEGNKTLLATPWARKVEAPEDKAGWKPYILEVLKNLRHADKSNWHHRMAMRAARIMYDDQKDAPAAIAAKNELSQQIFTKTMSIQVWRPEYERPGRHFVYTTRYVYFFVNLLDQLDDRAGLDQLLRRVRKKQGDFINHTKLWEDICLTYGRVIRRAGEINEGHEESIFKPIPWDVFVANTARLENLSDLAPQSVVLLELLRDSIELKKLNNNLMKVSQLEDLIADLYSRLYELNLPHVQEQATEESKKRMKVDHILMPPADSTADASAPTPPAGSANNSFDVPTAPRGRTKGIARRDVQKRAEAIVNGKLSSRTLNAKPAEKTTTSTTTTTTGAAAAAAAGGAAGGETDPSQQPPAAEAGAASSSAPPAPSKTAERKDRGSRKAGDGGNSDSELSEVGGEKLSKLKAERAKMFPGLKPSPGAEPGSEVSIPASLEGEGEGEGDGDGDEAAAGEGDADKEADGDDEAEPEGEGDTMVEESFVATGTGTAAGDETEIAEDDDDEDEDENENAEADDDGAEVGESTEVDIEGGGDGDGDGDRDGAEGDNEDEDDEGEREGDTEMLKESVVEGTDGNQPEGTQDNPDTGDKDDAEEELEAMDTQ